MAKLESEVESLHDEAVEIKDDLTAAQDKVSSYEKLFHKLTNATGVCLFICVCLSVSQRVVLVLIRHDNSG